MKTLRKGIYPGTKLLWNKGVELLKFKVIVRGHTIYGGEQFSTTLKLDIEILNSSELVGSLEPTSAVTISE